MDNRQLRHNGFHICDKSTQRQEDAQGVSMFIKIALSISLCVLVALANLVNIPILDNYIGSNNDTENNDEKLGRLQFVELPGIIEVFASSNSLSIPIEYTSAKLNSDKIHLTLYAKDGSTVTTCGSGVVKEVGQSKTLGGYVIVNHVNDISICYYGLENISVEERQQLQKLDTLGALRSEGILVLTINKRGAPQNPCDFLPVAISS